MMLHRKTKKRTFSEIEKRLLRCNFSPDYVDFENGGVYRFFRGGLIVDTTIPVLLYDDKNGHFIVELNGEIPPKKITEKSIEYYCDCWYRELMNIFFEEKGV